MIKGIGIDIIEIERIKTAVEKYGRSFLAKVFTARELKYCRPRRTYKYPELAARFAAKEAYAKALGTGIAGIGWRRVEVVNERSGRPRLAVRNKLDPRAQVSLSHSRDYAVAAVYLEE